MKIQQWFWKGFDKLVEDGTSSSAQHWLQISPKNRQNRALYPAGWVLSSFSKWPSEFCSNSRAGFVGERFGSSLELLEAGGAMLTRASGVTRGGYCDWCYRCEGFAGPVLAMLHWQQQQGLFGWTAHSEPCLKQTRSRFPIPPTRVYNGCSLHFAIMTVQLQPLLRASLNDRNWTRAMEVPLCSCLFFLLFFFF